MAPHSHSLKGQVQPIHRLSRHPWGRPLCPVPGSCQKMLKSLLASGRGSALSLQVRGGEQKGPLGRFLSAPLSKGTPGHLSIRSSGPARPSPSKPPPSLAHTPHHHTGYSLPGLRSRIRRAPGPRACDGLPGSSQARSPDQPKFSRVSDLPAPLRECPVPVPGVPVPKEFTASSGGAASGGAQSQAPAQSSAGRPTSRRL